MARVVSRAVIERVLSLQKTFATYQAQMRSLLEPLPKLDKPNRSFRDFGSAGDTPRRRSARHSNTA